jgi:hypothetical protein
MHKFDWRGETQNLPLGDAADSSRIFNEAKLELIENHAKLRAWFIQSKHKYEQR